MKEKEEDGAKSEAGRQWNLVDGFGAQDFGTRPADRERRAVESVGKERKVLSLITKGFFKRYPPFGYKGWIRTGGKSLRRVKDSDGSEVWSVGHSS